MTYDESNVGTTSGTGQGASKGMKEAWRSGDAERVKEEAKKLVEKGVAAVAGALKGFTETSQREEMPQQAAGAVREAGETAKQVTSETQSQVSTVGEQAKGLASEVKNQAKSVREQMGGKKSGGSESNVGPGPGSTMSTPTSTTSIDTLSTPTSTGSAVGTSETYSSGTTSGLGTAPGAPSTAERDLSVMNERAAEREFKSPGDSTPEPTSGDVMTGTEKNRGTRRTSDRL